MSRPYKSEEEKHTHRFLLAATSAEAEVIKAAAEAVNLPTAVFTRQTITEKAKEILKREL